MRKRSKRISPAGAMRQAFIFLVALLLPHPTLAIVPLPESVEVRVLSNHRLARLDCFSPGGGLTLLGDQGERRAVRTTENHPLQISRSGGRVRISSGKHVLGTFSRARLEPVQGLLVLKPGGKTRRSYRGSFTLEPDPERGVRVINRVSLDDYQKSVLPSEMGGGAPQDAYKAQAVLARTWVLVRLGRHRAEGYDFCDLTHCQSYQGADWERTNSSWAVDSTEGEIVTYKGAPIEVFYHSTCGGHTARAEEIWGDVKEPYLTGIPDSAERRAFCQGSEHMRWRFSASLKALRQALAKSPETNPGKALKDVVPVAYEASGRVSRVRIVGTQTREVTGEVFRTAVCRALGWSTVKSTWFTVHRQKGRIVLVGRGFGHGVGLCQWGARGRALAGETYRQIIEAYYPGAKVEKP